MSMSLSGKEPLVSSFILKPSAHLFEKRADVAVQQRLAPVIATPSSTPTRF